MISANQANDVYLYLNHVKNPNKNIHTRASRQENRMYVLKYLNGMKLVNGVCCGYAIFNIKNRPLIEIGYELNINGTINITNTSNVTFIEARTFVKTLSKNILEKVSLGFANTYHPRRRTGSLYLIRNKNPYITKSANSAINLGLLTHSFVAEMSNYNLIIIRGR